MPTLLIVDDHPAVRAGLAALVAPEPDFDVVASVADAETALTCAERHAPLVAVIDVHLPGEDGLSLCLRLEGSVAPTRTVLYSAFADDRLAVLAAVAGADALVPKSAEPLQLLDTLRAVAAGQRAAIATSPAALNTVGAALDPADLPVLGMLANGVPPAEVAETLGVPDDWLLARRWAILRRLNPRRTRRGALNDAPTVVENHRRSPSV